MNESVEERKDESVLLFVGVNEEEDEDENENDLFFVSFYVTM